MFFNVFEHDNNYGSVTSCTFCISLKYFYPWFFMHLFREGRTPDTAENRVRVMLEA